MESSLLTKKGSVVPHIVSGRFDTGNFSLGSGAFKSIVAIISSKDPILVAELVDVVAFDVRGESIGNCYSSAGNTHWELRSITI